MTTEHPDPVGRVRYLTDRFPAPIRPPRVVSELSLLADDLLVEIDRLGHLGDTLRDAAYDVTMRLHNGEVPPEPEQTYLRRSSQAWTGHAKAVADKDRS